MKMKVAIFRNEIEGIENEWIISCEKYKEKIDYTVIDITKNNWIERCLSESFDVYLTRPSGRQELYKRLYDERIYILNKILNKPIYPSINELLIYENKRFLSYWLKANNVPHPETYVFYNEKDAVNFSNTCDYPIVTKSNIGAGGKGVIIHYSKESLRSYITKVFKGSGATRGWLPNFRKGNILKRLIERLKKPLDFYVYLKRRKEHATSEPQKGFVIIQKYIKCDHEWRCVKISDSYFGHKKLRTWGEKISGTSAVSWDIPNERLLNLVKEVCEKGNFLSMGVDVFEDQEGNFFVNELQCFFGSKNPHQMIREGVPGRFFYKNGGWYFEEGAFNENNSYDLRLEHVIKLLEGK